MRDLTSVQFVGLLLAAGLTGAVVHDLVFARADRIRARRAEHRAAVLQKRVDRLETARTIRWRRPATRCDELSA